ncbi:hypothetical protein AB0F72_30435 [Actinoplanes sp. NPDC023936]|uniref:hypothetical protein n=1 Tax=Actinoplanes sp. NPDC023936 TaxID=3154910 RepID=UPI0033F62206
MSDSLSSPDEDLPDGFENLMLLTPEQWEMLMEAREEQQHDLSREQVEALLKAFGEPRASGLPGGRHG